MVRSRPFTLSRSKTVQAPKRQRIKGPACIANLAEWAEEAEKGVVVAAGTQALAAMGDRITLHAQTVNTLTSPLANLALEGQELKQDSRAEERESFTPDTHYGTRGASTRRRTGKSERCCKGR